MKQLFYWFKWIISYIYATIYRRSIQPRFGCQDIDVDYDPYKADFLPFPHEITLDSPLEESHLITTADEIFFYGVNSKSEYLITEIKRRTNQEAECLVFFKLRNGKMYQLLETSGYQQATGDKRIFSCGGLQMYFLSPMRRWRIFFNGVLQETDENGLVSDKLVHVKFALLWLASTNVFDFRTDVDTKALSTSLAKATWNQRTPPVKLLFSALDFYAQCGNIMGTISINGSDEEELYLFGERWRFFGNVSSLKGMEFFHVLGQMHKDGRFIHVVEVSLKNVVEKFIFGFVSVLTGGIRRFNEHCSLEKFVSDGVDIKSIFQAAGQLFCLNGTELKIPCILHNDVNLNDSFKIDLLDFKLISQSADGKKPERKLNTSTGEKRGRGIGITREIKEISRKVIPESFFYSNDHGIPLVVSFPEKVCQNPNITGGKGSSLGKLTELSKEIKSFNVPKGVVVTTRAYDLFVTENILEEIRNLEKDLYQNKVDEVKAVCQKLAELFLETTMPEQITQSLFRKLQNMTSDRKIGDQFAVRSSATGEDTEQLSAAGQLVTYLGVTGISNIMTAIKKCWASQFGYIAVQYKRQNGQPINTPMAVVVQEMVSCDVAGVLFTCDPLTGNPTTMTISANYGLGESVVSASAEPDTIEIERKENDVLAIKNKIIGKKSHKIVLTEKGGTTIEDNGDGEKLQCCLSDDAALYLAHIAVLMEKSCKSHRDLEWGFWNNNLQIFQSRPITSSSTETDFEIDREFDSALHGEEEFVSLTMVGEVLPGATTPLSLDVIMKYFKTVFQSNRFMSHYTGELPQYYSRSVGTIYRHFMIFIVDLFKIARENVFLAEVFSLAFFSRVLKEEELFEMAKERYSDDFGKIIDMKLSIKIIYRILFCNKLQLKRLSKTYDEYTVSLLQHKNSQEMFDHLLYHLSDLTLSFGNHWIQTDCSAFLNMLIILVLRKAAGEINTDVYNDFAMLLKGGEIENLNVPLEMERVVSCISKDINPESFKKMNTKVAINWLENSSSEAGKMYREFIKKNGHRCLKEYDFYSKTWKSDPQPLVKLLQSMVGRVIKEQKKKNFKNYKDLISELKCPISYSSKLFLRIILPLSRRAVQNRECSKSIVMRVVNAFRNEFRNLAKLMVLEGRIPDEDILFFMTLDEVKELLETRSPRIISKAKHRQRRQPILDKMKFPEIFRGFPKPINACKKTEGKSVGNLSLKGIPVSQGRATGKVRVALDLEEASYLQPGEILVTYSTDIGWSPYFPILEGVVTEIGGLVSHGAVISREYGLPCVSGLVGATQYFKTGDFVLLDATKGILQKIQEPKNS